MCPSATELPPPPASPELPPPVFLAGEEPVRIRTEDGLTLVGLGRFPARAERVVVLCHPHPLYGGTMHNAVVLILAKYLLEKGGDRVATLRFNYRGVDGSEGLYDRGVREALDVRAALASAAGRAPHARVSVAAYSFGTRVSLAALVEPDATRALAEAALATDVERFATGQAVEPVAPGPIPEVDRLALIAPAVRIFSFPEHLGAFRGTIEVFAGDADQFSDIADVRTLSDRFSAVLHVIEGSDHYFIRYRRKLAELVVPFVAPEIAGGTSPFATSAP